jgi:hypothetical protein
VRNQEQHGCDHHARAEADQRESRRRLATIYAQRASYEPNVQALLHNDETDHNQQHPAVIRNWIATNEQVFRDSARRVRDRIRKGVQSLLPFLIPRVLNG